MYFSFFLFFFFFNDTATTEIYTLSLHDALPIYTRTLSVVRLQRHWLDTPRVALRRCRRSATSPDCLSRSEEHTSELQSLAYLVCRLLLEKKKKILKNIYNDNIITPSIFILYFYI